MRVTMLTTWEGTVCGIHDYSANLVRALRKRLDVTVVPVEFGRWKGEGAEAYYRDLGRSLGGADLAHIQHEYGMFGGGVLPPTRRNRREYPEWVSYFHVLRKEVRIPLVMTVHEVGSPEGKIIRRNPVWRALQTRQQRAFHRSMFRSAERCIVHSGMHRDLLVERGVDPRRIRWLPHGIPQEGPDGEREDPGAPVPPPGPEGPVRLGMIGFVVKRKGYLVALDALAGLPSGFELVMIGGRFPRDEAGEYEEVTARVRDLGLESRVRITGYLPLEELREEVRRCHLILAPQVEGFVSGSLTHALISGRPVVAADIEPNREIVDRVACLRLFPAGDPGALREAILDLASDPAELEGLARGAGEYSRRYGYDHVAERTMQVYREVLPSSGPDRRGSAGAVEGTRT
jgi:glycosyltransferase involved in cell wall biosynthesis